MLTETQRKMASVQEIASLSPIENSDFLEIAMMKDLGWKVVVKKGEFKAGDKVIYFEIDSAINIKDLFPFMDFLKEKNVKKLFTGRTPDASAFSGEYARIKTIKLRGQISQGLIVPLRSFIEILPIGPDIRFPIGTDLTEVFKVEVWDRLVEWYEERSQLGTRVQMHSAGTFPSDVPKTDEVRLQADLSVFDNPEWTNAEWEMTVKNDGSSTTLFYRPLVWPEDPMKISSRRFLLKDDGGSDEWFDAFKRIGWDLLKERLEKLFAEGISVDGETLLPNHELAIQGETTGAKYNGNRDKNTENHFRVFRIFDIVEQKFVSPKIRYAICKFLGLEHVKVLETCKIFKKLKTLDDFLAYADGESENGNKREGVVFKRVDDGSVSFKVVSNNYLLKNGD